MSGIEKRIEALEKIVGLKSTDTSFEISVVYVDTNGEVEPGFSFKIGSAGRRSEPKI